MWSPDAEFRIQADADDGEGQARIQRDSWVKSVGYKLPPPPPAPQRPKGKQSSCTSKGIIKNIHDFGGPRRDEDLVYFVRYAVGDHP